MISLGTLNDAAFGTLLSTATLTAGHFSLVTAVHAAPVVNFIEQPFGAQAVTRTLALTPLRRPGSRLPRDPIVQRSTPR